MTALVAWLRACNPADASTIAAGPFTLDVASPDSILVGQLTDYFCQADVKPAAFTPLNLSIRGRSRLPERYPPDPSGGHLCTSGPTPHVDRVSEFLPRASARLSSSMSQTIVASSNVIAMTRS
jgi:hypothetical protein